MRAQIAGCCFLFDGRFFAAWTFGIIGHHFEWMEIDISVRTIARAESAADAPIFDDDFERIAPSNRADRTSNHAQRIAALPATGRNKVLFESKAVADEASHAVVRVGAGIHAGVAPRTFLQIQNEEALCFHQSLRQKLIDGDAVDEVHALLVGLLTFLGDGFEAGSNGGEAFDHLAEIVAGDSNDFDVIESGAGGGSNVAAEQADFTEIVAARKIGEYEFAAGIALGDFHEPDSNEIEIVGGIALESDDLSRSETLKFDAFF
jgi:hypothetical protein